MMTSSSPSFWKSTKPCQNDAVDTPANSQNPNPPPSSPLYLSFNQNHANFTAGTDRGFQVFSCDPFVESMRRDLTGGGGGIGIVEMLFGSNLFALVGGGSNPQYPPNKVMIWDDYQGRCIGELSFLSNIRGVRLRRDRIVIILTQKVHVYNLMNLKKLDQFETAENKGGLCDITQGAASSFVLATLGVERGQIRVEHYGALKRKLIDGAHLGRIACLALSQDGQWLATASFKGTLIRIFNARDRTLLQELRRGVDRADIYSLAFSTTAQWLAVSSDKGTIHVFSLKTNFSTLHTDDGDHVSNSNLTVATTSTSSFSFIQGILPTYFSSERSLAQFRVTEDCQYIVAFGHQKDTLIILGFDGSFYRCKFDPLNGGEMSQLEYHNILKPEGALEQNLQGNTN